MYSNILFFYSFVIHFLILLIHDDEFLIRNIIFNINKTYNTPEYEFFICIPYIFNEFELKYFRYILYIYIALYYKMFMFY